MNVYVIKVWNKCDWVKKVKWGKHGLVAIKVFYKVMIFQDIECNKKYVNAFKPMLLYAQLGVNLRIQMYKLLLTLCSNHIVVFELISKYDSFGIVLIDKEHRGWLMVMFLYGVIWSCEWCSMKLKKYESVCKWRNDFLCERRRIKKLWL